MIDHDTSQVWLAGDDRNNQRSIQLAARQPQELVKKLIALFLLLGVSGCPWAEINRATANRLRSGHADGILQSIENGDLVVSGDKFLVKRRNHSLPVVMTFSNCLGLGLSRDQDRWWVLPISSTRLNDYKTDQIEVNSGLWVMPVDALAKDHSWHVELHDGMTKANYIATSLKVSADTDSFTISQSEARPHSDPFGHRFSIKIEDGSELEEALAGFYWGTMLPLVVEKTLASHFPYSSGYVLSTLKVSAYAGSYPAVDHEFQIKGRLAMGSEADLDIVKRMIELQFKLMKDDPERLHRAPTSVQPDGRREYHVRRDSMDKRENAAMFPLTGNIEVLEEAWHYYEARKDVDWLSANIANLEEAATWTLASVDQYGRVWSDVYYEDQVIKDGRETQAQAFAANSLGLLAEMERILGRQGKAELYAGDSEKIAHALIEPLPLGYWDQKNQRFTDWVDRNGQVHDHIHLVANTLPVTLGYATAAQGEAVRELVSANNGQFERFPSFLAVDIAGYNKSEIGTGGPYDLSAAGRYWYWDAAYRESQKESDMLMAQLKAVAAEGAKDNYYMGERYDMDYVYYIDGKNAHGAEKYYEYPNVFTAILISKFLGITVPVDADVSIAPHLNGYGTVEFDIPEYAVRYRYDKDGFSVKNLSDKWRRFKVNLSALGANTSGHQPRGWNLTKSGPELKAEANGASWTATLSGQEEIHWNAVQ